MRSSTAFDPAGPAALGGTPPVAGRCTITIEDDGPGWIPSTVRRQDVRHDLDRNAGAAIEGRLSWRRPIQERVPHRLPISPPVRGAVSAAAPVVSERSAMLLRPHDDQRVLAFHHLRSRRTAGHGSRGREPRALDPRSRSARPRFRSPIRRMRARFCAFTTHRSGARRDPAQQGDMSPRSWLSEAPSRRTTTAVTLIFWCIAMPASPARPPP